MDLGRDPPSADDAAPNDTAPTPETVDAILDQARGHSESGLWSLAIERYEAALALDAKRAEIWFELGLARRSQGETEGARAAWQQALSIQPEASGVHFQLALLYEEEGKHEAAVQAFKSCLDHSTEPGECTEARKRMQALLRRHPGLATGRRRAPHAAETYAREYHLGMLRRIRNWGIVLIVMGGLLAWVSFLRVGERPDMAGFGFTNAAWGIILFIVGASSFFFREAAMFVVYGAALAWIALTNFLSHSTGGTIIGVIQSLLALHVFRQFGTYHRAERTVSTTTSSEQRAPGFFPPLAAVLGILSLGGVIVLLLTAILIGLSGGQAPALLRFIEPFLVHLGVIGFAVGLASLLSGYSPRWAALLGAIAAGVMLLSELVVLPYVFGRYERTADSPSPPALELGTAPAPTAAPPAPAAMARLGPGWSSYTAADGLVGDDVRAITVAPDGCLWFGTTEGVSRFDGAMWENYSTLNGLPDERVEAIAVSPDNAIWLGTGDGLVRFDEAGGRIYQNQAIHNRIIWDILPGPDGGLWVATQGAGVFRFDGRDLIPYSSQRGSVILSISVGPDGALWFGTWDGGALRFDGHDWTTYHPSEETLGNRVQAIAVGPEGAMWFGTAAGVYRVYDGRWTGYTAEDGLAGDNVQAVAVGPDGALWFGTTSGVSRFDPPSDPRSGEPGVWTTHRTADGLTHNTVRAIAAGPDGALWFGTAAGVCRYLPEE